MKKHVFLVVIFVITLMTTAAIPAKAQLYAQFGHPGGMQVTVGIGGGYGYPAGYFSNYGYGYSYNAAAYAQCVNRGFWICRYYEGYPYFGDSIYYQSQWIMRQQYMQMRYGYYGYNNGGYGYGGGYSGRNHGYHEDHRRRR